MNCIFHQNLVCRVSRSFLKFPYGWLFNHTVCNVVLWTSTQTCIYFWFAQWLVIMEHIKNWQICIRVHSSRVWARIIMTSCRIPIRHFFSQSRRLLTKIFESVETVNEKFRCLWIRGQGAIKLGYNARYLFPPSPSSIKPGTSQAGLNREVPKSPST